MKKIIAMLLACVMVLGLAACGGSTTEATEPAGNEVTDVTLKVWGPQEDQVDESSWLIAMEKAFAEAHPEYNTSQPLSSPSPPTLNLSQHQDLFYEWAFCIRWPKYWSSALAPVLPINIQG